MAKAKITWEFADNCHDIIIHKAKGRLTLDEVYAFMQTREMRNAFEGALLVWQFRSMERDETLDIFEGETEGDSVLLQVINDGDSCPLCGRHDLFPQYCPDCGSLIKWPKEARA